MFFSTWILRTFFDKYGAPISLEQFWMEGYHSMDRMLAQHMFSLENDHIPFPPVAGYAGTTHLYKVKSNTVPAPSYAALDLKPLSFISRGF